MTPAPPPLTRDLVLIGGGHAHALVLKRWGMNPLPGARVTLVNPGPTAPYTGMLPGFVAGHYRREALEIDLVRLARFAGARIILGHAEGFDLPARRIRIAGRGEIAYDVASIDIGITSAMPELPGFSLHGVAAKPLGPFADRWSDFLSEGGRADIAVIGAGVAGAELAMAMAHALEARGREASISLLEATTALSGLARRTRAAIVDRLGRIGIRLLEGVRAVEVRSDSVLLDGGEEIASDLTIGAAGARPWEWLAATGLAHKNGFLDVDESLRTSDPAVYAAGDCADLVASPRPKAGVYAVRAAPVLTHNLRASLSGGLAKPFKPQGDFLKLISLGGKDAVGEKWGLTRQGPGIWSWKDRIDRRFMKDLAHFPDMAAPAPPLDVALGVHDALSGGKPLCGGCGAKIGAGALDAGLARTAGAARGDVNPLPGDDAGLLTMGETRQVITTDHLRAVTADPHLMARIAAVHALGDIWAMGAEPQAALATVILPRLSEALQERWLEEIMAGAGEIFREVGAAIAGGHTSQGDELTIGFAVTGLLAGSPVTRAGAKPGDALVLTRPIGSGTILAAEMALGVPGDQVAALLAEMARPQSAAAAALSGAHAMTDVTGYGLAGHLLGICRASGVGAKISLAAVPVYPGAVDLTEKGIRSTLYPANEAAALPETELPDDPRTPLLFDPQTAGGLLAALPEKEAEAAVRSLQRDGIPASRIGTVTDGPPRITVTA